jgi:hypothetical protein
MGYPPVVVVESGGVPRTQVAEGVSAPAFTVVDSGARPITLADNAPPIALFNPDGSPYSSFSVRTVRASDDMFYEVLRVGSAAKVVRYERNMGASGGTDLGNKWPEARVTGLGFMSGYSSNPATATLIMDEVGACDTVGRSAGGINFGSYHGLGAAGALNSQSFLIDGVSCDPFAADVEGTTLEVRNNTTASDGTNFYTRELVITNQADGTLAFSIPTVSASGMTLVYVGMPMASGNGFSEIDVRYGTAWNVIPLGTGVASAGLAAAKAVRMRDPTTGYYVTGSGELQAIANFVRARTEKQTVEQRSKTYLAQFSSVAALAGAEWTLEWGAGTAGSVAPSTSLVSALWASPWDNAPGPTGGTVTVNGADLDMVWSSGTSNLRFSSPISGVAIGQVYAISVDLISNNASTRLMLASNGSSTTSPTLSITADVGRNIEVFTASYANQRMMVRAASTIAASTKWRSPAAYLIAA